MEILHTKLKNVPAASRLELLVYAAAQEVPVVLKIVTNAGSYYYGYALNVSGAKMGGGVMLFQVINQQNGATIGILHVDISSVESVEIAANNDAFQILSLGWVQPAQSYTVSGRLDVKRSFKTLADTINQAYQLQLKEPEMKLPEDGNALNRIIKLTQIIQQTIVEVLKEEDARISWQTKYAKLIFLDSENLEVKEKAIYFIFIFHSVILKLLKFRQSN